MLDARLLYPAPLPPAVSDSEPVKRIGAPGVLSRACARGRCFHRLLQPTSVHEHPNPIRFPRAGFRLRVRPGFRPAGVEHLSIPDFGSRRRLTPRRELRSDRAWTSVRGRLSTRCRGVIDHVQRRRRNLWRPLPRTDHRFRCPIRSTRYLCSTSMEPMFTNPRTPSTFERPPLLPRQTRRSLALSLTWPGAGAVDACSP